MIALDLSPLLFDAHRGVARALSHLLLGLARVPRRVRLAGILPGGEWRDVPGALDQLVAAGGSGSRRTQRAAVASTAERLGARALFSPYARLPATELPCVAWVHELPSVRLGAIEGRVRAWTHAQALAVTAERAAALIVPSQAVRSDLARVAFARRPPVHVVQHGFDPAPWSRAMHAAPSGVPYALLIGSGARAGGARKKGLDLFAAALASGRLGGLDGVLVDAVGGAQVGPWRVALAPDDAALARLLSGARMLVVPSRSEGFGYPMLEAFAAGVPVVAAAAGALPEVSGGAAHLVPPGDAGALADGMARVHGDEALRGALVAAGRTRAGAFPPEVMAQAWLGVLEPLAGCS